MFTVAQKVWLLQKRLIMTDIVLLGQTVFGCSTKRFGYCKIVSIDAEMFSCRGKC
jgi:hypothetical protein